MAKLQDTLEVFMEELEKVQASISSFKEINPTIDSKINEIKKLALKVEISNLESANQIFLKNLEKQYLMIDEKTNQHLKNFEKMMQKEKSYFNRYYKIGISFLVVFLLSITLAIKFYLQSKEFEKFVILGIFLSPIAPPKKSRFWITYFIISPNARVIIAR